MWKKNVKDIDGEVLCVSQFTLFANTTKGKPDFHRAMVCIGTISNCARPRSADLSVRRDCCSLPHVPPRQQGPPGSCMALSSRGWANCIGQRRFKVRCAHSVASGSIHHDTRLVRLFSSPRTRANALLCVNRRTVWRDDGRPPDERGSWSRVPCGLPPRLDFLTDWRHVHRAP